MRKYQNKILIIILIIILLVIVDLKILNKRIIPNVMNYAEQESYKIGTLIINDAVSKKIVEELNIDDLFIITYDKNGEIVSIDFNTLIVNEVLTKTTHQVELSLKYLETERLDLIDLPKNITIKKDNKEGLLILVPSGIALNNVIFSNLGPKIPLKIEMIGSVITGIDTKVTNYGINNALIELYLNIEVSLNVILPFISKKETIKTSIPLALKMLNGRIPEYYLNGYLSNPINVS